MKPIVIFALVGGAVVIGWMVLNRTPGQRVAAGQNSRQPGARRQPARPARGRQPGDTPSRGLTPIGSSRNASRSSQLQNMLTQLGRRPAANILPGDNVTTEPDGANTTSPGGTTTSTGTPTTTTSTAAE